MTPSNADQDGFQQVRSKPCYFHNHGGCNKTDEECRFNHELLPAAEQAVMVRPSHKAVGRSRSPLTSVPITAYLGNNLCRFHLNGTCNRENCRFTHVDGAEAERLIRVKASAAPKATARPKAKGKAKAKTSPAAAASPATAVTLADYAPFIIKSE